MHLGHLKRAHPAPLTARTPPLLQNICATKHCNHLLGLSVTIDSLPSELHREPLEATCHSRS